MDSTKYAWVKSHQRKLPSGKVITVPGYWRKRRG